MCYGTDIYWAFLLAQMVKKKKSVCNADLGSIPGLRRSFGEGHGNPLQYSHLGNPMDRGAWWAPQFRGSQRVRHD